MRPKELVMSGFGSYAGKETVDFTVVDHGIFLITGDTGAGKTTIFDGIVFALYDQTSGGKRDGNMMRSQYASLDTPTYVEFVFLYRNQEYRIKRNPEYQREKKRKAADGTPGFTTERAGVELTLPDGTVFMGNRIETNKKIVEILGVDAQQFTQIAMIAQGDFLKLLHAQSQERKIIFSKLFNTRIYWRIQENLKYRAKECFEKLEDSEKDFRREAEQIHLPEGNDYAGLINELKLRPDIERTREIVEIFVKGGKEKEKCIRKEYDQNYQEAEEVKRVLDMAQSINRLFDELEMAKSERDEQAAMKEQFEHLKEQLMMGRKAETTAFKEQDYLEKKLSYEKIRMEISQLEERLKEKEGSLKAARETAERWEVQQREQAPKLHKMIARIQDALPDYQKLEEKRWVASLKMRQSVMRKAQEAYRQIYDNYDQLYEAYVAAAAGILAKELKEGEKCPVCGSLHHPDKAKLTEKVPSKELLDRVKKEREQAKEKQERAEKEYQEALKVEQEIKMLEEGLPYKTLKEAKSALAEAQAKLRMLEREVKDARTELQRQQQEAMEEKGRKKVLAQNENDAKERSAQARQMYIEELQRAGFADEEDYQRFKISAEKLQEIQMQIQSFQERVIKTEEAIRVYESQTEGKHRIAADELQARIDELAVVKARLEEERQQLFVQNTRNDEIKKQLKRIHEEQIELKGQYQVTVTLSRTANGTLHKSIKLDFETYIQRQFFKQIIKLANMRFARMTANQLVLRCREIKDLGTQGQVGLDLDVYSPVTNSTRDVKTLSGGESFLAALSMALGLADVIQNTAGAIQLDTMFIDEGFGSLDDEAREQAIQILNELAGEKRLVGIISHVTELKEQIERKLVVERKETGSCLAWRL